MHPVSRARANGFTMIEAAVALAIVSLTLGLGIPALSGWMNANKAAAASEFYLEGFRTARAQALAHNAQSRIVLTNNATSGQMDWQVDICFPVPGTPCTAVSTNWSTTTTAATDDHDPASPFLSMRRNADVISSSSNISITREPVNASAIYYTPLGWVDPAIGNRLTRLRLDPIAAGAADLPTTAVAVTLAGMASRCNVDLAITDSRGCPP